MGEGKLYFSLLRKAKKREQASRSQLMLSPIPASLLKAFFLGE